MSWYFSVKSRKLFDTFWKNPWNGERGEKNFKFRPLKLRIYSVIILVVGYRLLLKGLSNRTHHPVGPHAGRHALHPIFDNIVNFGCVGLLIECSDKHKVERKMSAGWRMITVVQHCLIKGRVTFDHHEPKMPQNRYNNMNQLTEKRHPLVVIRLKKKIPYK